MKSVQINLLNEPSIYPLTEAKVLTELLKWGEIENTILKRVVVPTNSFTFIKVTDNNEKLVVSFNVLSANTPGFGAFLRTSCTSFICFEKTNKKLYTKNAHTVLSSIFENPKIQRSLNLDWIEPKFQNILNKNNTILKAVFSRKCKNNADLLKTYLSSYWKIKVSDFPAKYFYKILKSTQFTNDEIRIICLLLTCSVSKENTLQNISKILKYPHLFDLVSQLRLLNKKIKFPVSYNELNNVHASLSKQIADLKFSYSDEKRIDLNVPPPDDNHFTMLLSNKDFYKEGNELSHCLFSNDYFRYSQNKSRFYFSFKSENERGTAEIIISGNALDHRTGTFLGKSLKLGQFYGKRNIPMSKTAHNICKQFIEHKLYKYFVETRIIAEKIDSFTYIQQLYSQRMDKPDYQEPLDPTANKSIIELSKRQVIKQSRYFYFSLSLRNPNGDSNLFKRFIQDYNTKLTHLYIPFFLTDNYMTEKNLYTLIKISIKLPIKKSQSLESVKNEVLKHFILMKYKVILLDQVHENNEFLKTLRTSKLHLFQKVFNELLEATKAIIIISTK